jgi:hypothetical protein
LNLEQAGSGVPRVESVLLQEVTELLDLKINAAQCFET